MSEKDAYNPKIMGIINVTPDSFSDGGQFHDAEKAIAHGLQLIKDGADVLDIGGESTRPGSESISIEEELARVIPVIEGLRKENDIPISIDTRHAEVMEEALKAGATMINDVTALKDEAALAIASAADASVCLMHMQGEPGTMQDNPQYLDIINDIKTFFAERIVACEGAGILKEQIYIDVGIGFGKTLEHNITLLKNLDVFADLGTKMVLGTSRKSFISKIAGESEATDRIGGSLASLVPALHAKVDMLRVHDVKETKQFISVYQKVTSE